MRASSKYTSSMSSIVTIRLFYPFADLRGTEGGRRLSRPLLLTRQRFPETRKAEVTFSGKSVESFCLLAPWTAIVMPSTSLYMVYESLRILSSIRVGLPRVLRPGSNVATCFSHTPRCTCVSFLLNGTFWPSIVRR